MAKTPGSKKAKKATKKPAKKSGGSAKKTGTGTLEKLLKEISQRNQNILKEARKIDDLLNKARPQSVGRPLFAEGEDVCPPGTSIQPIPPENGD